MFVNFSLTTTISWLLLLNNPLLSPAPPLAKGEGCPVWILDKAAGVIDGPTILSTEG